MLMLLPVGQRHVPFLAPSCGRQQLVSDVFSGLLLTATTTPTGRSEQSAAIREAEYNMNELINRYM